MTDTAVAALEAVRRDVNSRIDQAIASLRQSANPLPSSVFKLPSPEDGRDPRNKNGQNLTERGVEILFRVFDDGGGYNRASKLLNISQGAAKNRKAQWISSGGASRTKKVILDMDSLL